MSKDQLKHIFEESACLTPRQVKGYVTGKMVHEEAHAVEVHLLSCPFCREAVEGIAEQKSPGAVSAMEKLDAGFIAKHFGVTAQEVTPAKNIPSVTKARPEKDKPKTVRNIWKPMALAASLLAIVAVLWFMRDNIFPQDDGRMAQQIVLPEKPAEEVIAYTPAADSNITVMADSMAISEQEMAPEELPVAVEQPADIKPREIKEVTATEKEAEKNMANARLAAETSLAKKTRDEVKPIATAARQSSADALPRMGNSYSETESASKASATVADKTAEKEEVAEVRKNTEPARSGLEKADDLFNKGKYRRALKIYQDEMGDTRSNRRDAATFMAARCHVELGEKMQARTLLNSLVNENSVKKPQAQQVLQQLGDE